MLVSFMPACYEPVNVHVILAVGAYIFLYCRYDFDMNTKLPLLPP